VVDYPDQPAPPQFLRPCHLRRSCRDAPSRFWRASRIPRTPPSPRQRTPEIPQYTRVRTLVSTQGRRIPGRRRHSQRQPATKNKNRPADSGRA